MLKNMETLNLVDINYAIEVKEEFSFEDAYFENSSETKVWVENVEEENFKTPPLLIQSRPIAGADLFNIMGKSAFKKFKALFLL